jgi:3-methyladenine DNA glycosylase/8-oxoguanine DNA glycosylase
MEFFRYGPEEINYLKERDRDLGRAIDVIGMIEREVIPDLFSALVRSVVAQQVSSKGAATVWRRLCACVGEMTPGGILAAGAVRIQQCGLSMRKAEYIRGIANAAASGELELSSFSRMSDEEIISVLSRLNGIGVWTAEMLLIFSLCRPDVVSWGDLAIRRGMMKLYGLDTLSREQFSLYRSRYSPHGSVASLYLWALSAADKGAGRVGETGSAEVLQTGL